MDGKGDRLKMNGVISVCWLVNETGAMLYAVRWTFQSAGIDRKWKIAAAALED